MTKSSPTTIQVTQQSGSFGPFYAQFIEPWLTQIGIILNDVIMQPYAWNGVGNFGYDPNVGLYGGGAIEPSAAIIDPTTGRPQGTSTRAYIIADNNHEGAAAVDYWNTVLGTIYTSTDIIGAVRTQYASPNWYVVGSCVQPFKHVSYPSSFAPYLNRWEFALGSSSPYYSQMVAGTVHPGGIGPDGCVGGEQGQINWQLASANATIEQTPPMVTVFPRMSPLGIGTPTSFNLESQSFEVMARFLHGDITWKTGYQNALNQYPFSSAPRDAYHFVRLSLLTAAWSSAYSFTVGGISAKQALLNTLTKIFTPYSQGGAYGGSQGMAQSWGPHGGAGPDHRPEANMQTMAMMDPNGPIYFGVNDAS